VFPLVAIMLMVLTGFTALSVGAGMDYAQSRSDHDVSDAASLAAAYAIKSGASLLNAFTAASQLGTLDGCNTSSCHVPSVNTTGTEPYLEVWTTTTFTSGSSPTDYVSISGACSATVTGNFSISNCPTLPVTYVGAPVGDTSTNYFAGAVGAAAHSSVTANAVAQVTGTGSGGSGVGTQTINCALCETGGGLTMSGGTISTSGADIDLDGTLTCSGTSFDANGGGHNYVAASSACSATWNPAPVLNHSTADPLAAMAMPTIPSSTGSNYYGSPSYTLSNNTVDLNPGVYGTLTLAGNGTVSFASGLYVFTGGMTVSASGTMTLEDTSAGVTLYFTCGTSTAPASCASGGATGASLSMSGNVQWSLTAITTGAQENVVVIFDRHNTSGVTNSATLNSGDLNDAVYIPYGTYTSSGGTALGIPLIVYSITGSGFTENSNAPFTLPSGTSQSVPGNLVQ
jgi:hypothetical protein